MERTTEEFKMLIFDLMNGSLDLTNNPPEESTYVEDESQKTEHASKHIQRYWMHTGVCVNVWVLERKMMI